jgi:cytochrome P450/acyl-CoA synthetase (AMP-forming)/AMP-acid ligase II
MRPFDVLGWTADPSEERGVRYFDGRAWPFYSYAELLGRAAAVQRQIASWSIGPAPVLLALPNSPRFFAAFFGCLGAGAVPAPVCPSRFGGVDFAAATVRAAHAVSAAAVVVGSDQQRLALSGCGLRVAVPEEAEGAWTAVERGPATPLLIQFTSGSSGSPRPVVVTGAMLEHNLASWGSWLDVTSSDCLATWLPVHHDLGLVSHFLMPAALQLDVWAMSGEQFIRTPGAWLACFGRQGATCAAMPNFGFDYLVRRMANSAVREMDFSAWRVALVGAERIDALVMDRFVRLLEPYGFDARAVVPAYGLAEATLGVTMKGHRSRVSLAAVERSALALCRPVRVNCEARLGDGTNVAGDLDTADKTDTTEWLVGCGPPLPGVEVTIESREGETLAEDMLGEVVVRSPSLAVRLGPGGEAPDDWSAPEVLRTGDAGFLHRGELYVVGRMGDAVAVRGRNVFAEDVETALRHQLGWKARRVAVLAGAGPDPLVIIATETELDDPEAVRRSPGMRRATTSPLRSWRSGAAAFSAPRVGSHGGTRCGPASCSRKDIIMTTTTEADGLLLSLLSSGGGQDPYAAYSVLHALGPVHRTSLGILCVTGYDTCSEVLTDARFIRDPFAKARRAGMSQEEIEQHPVLTTRRSSLIFLNPPEHTRLRALVNRVFSNQAVALLRSFIQTEIDILVEDISRKREVDVVHALAYPLPVRIIGALLGIPRKDVEYFRDLIHSTVSAVDPVISPGALAVCDRKAEEADSYFRALLEARRKDRRDDILSYLLMVEEDGERISDQEIVNLAITLCFAGFETTAFAVGTAVLALARFPQQLALLRDRTDLDTAAVHEFIRYDQPIQFTGRTASEPADLHGCAVEAGQSVILVLGAASHDPEKFDAPHALDIERRPLPNPVFGAGPHYCLGAALARVEISMTVRTLVDRFTTFRQISDPVYNATITFRGMESLVVEFVA